MNEIHLTDRALSALAFLVSELRPDWQTPGITTALTQARRPGRDGAVLIRAAVNAALSPKVRTPAVIALDGEHWNGTTTGGSSALPSVFCGECGEVRHGREPCRKPDPIDPERMAAAKAAAFTAAAQRKPAFVPEEPA